MSPHSYDLPADFITVKKAGLYFQFPVFWFSSGPGSGIGSGCRGTCGGIGSGIGSGCGKGVDSIVIIYTPCFSKILTAHFPINSTNPSPASNML